MLAREVDKTHRSIMTQSNWQTFRRKIAARLGLAADASNETIFAAVDAEAAARAAAATAAPVSAEDAAYYALFPDEAPGAPARIARDDDAEYLALFPDERPR
ncbi:hypothetical protein ASC59_06030 [Leifsonia sp. Root1293]|nr:hypothetical protein ASC59_06030 [Leifsonia sp. Root1293]KRA11617.1 hypothetical protein ASD61_06030 [Leifsonia sp. Root60]